MSNSNIPELILVATPNEEIQIKDFFSEQDNKLVELLKNPPKERYSGWNMLTLDQPKIKDGDCWEVASGDVKQIRLYSDLSLIAKAKADSSFLGWGNNVAPFEDVPLLNSLAVIEYIFEFVRLYKEMLTNVPHPSKITFAINLYNTTLPNNKKLFIKPNTVNDIFYFSRNINTNYLVKGDFQKNIEVELDENVYDEDAVAFKLVSQFFLQFGISSDKIPYSNQDKDGE